MNAQIMNEALLATARVACCAALLGCGPGNAKKADTQIVPEAAAETTVSADMPAEPPAAAMSLEECQVHIAKAFDKADNQQASKDVSDETKACCQAVAEHHSDGAMNLGAWPERGQCCSALDWRGSMACTPWGPPVPPAMFTEVA